MGISHSKYTVQGGEYFPVAGALNFADVAISTGSFAGSQTGVTPILRNTYLHQIIHYTGGGDVRYYSPASDQEFIDFLPNMGAFTYTGYYSASYEIAVLKLSTLTSYKHLSRNATGNPLWNQSNGANYYMPVGNQFTQPSGEALHGLVVYLDATVEESYEEAGKARDISGAGIVFNTVGTNVARDSNIATTGYPGWKFESNGYFECSVNPRVWDGGDDMTVIMILHGETKTTRRTIFELKGGPYSSYQQSIAMTWETSGAISYYSRYSPSYDSGSTTALGNGWFMVAIKFSNGLTSGARNAMWRKDGGDFTTNYTSNSNTALIRGNNIRIGGGYAGTMDNCALGAVMLFNRELNDTEVDAIYNHLTPKFGIFLP
tara:strand:- start:60 stop:1181 length:1122 start_codon:yes stop_codon:yes gene_type:complete